MRLQRCAEAVARLYRRLDLHTDSFRAASGLSCLPGCGSCCLSPEVEATVLELLPAAFQLRREGRLEQTLDVLEAEPTEAVCLLYVAEPRRLAGGARGARGHCGLYAHRALLCRLFGFAAILNREGRQELSTCRLIRAAQPQAAAAATAAIEQGTVLVPVMGNYRMELYGIDPSLGTRLLPINLALAQALAMVGLDGRRRGGWRTLDRAG